jgi:hypothetical protein
VTTHVGGRAATGVRYNQSSICQAPRMIIHRLNESGISMRLRVLSCLTFLFFSQCYHFDTKSLSFVGGPIRSSHAGAILSGMIARL